MLRYLRARFAGGIARFGWPGILGLGLGVFACAFYASALRPDASRLAELRRQSAQLQAQAGERAASAPQTPAQRLALFYTRFPGRSDIPDQLQKIYAAAKEQGLELEEGDYRLAQGGEGALAQLQISLPVRGSYPQIRKFVDVALADDPTLALDRIEFERQKIGDAALQVKVRLTLYFGARS